MKHQYLSLLAGGALLALSACSADEPVVSTNGDGNVTFTVSLPGAMTTRDGETTEEAFANGKTAKKLYYYVYDLDNNKFIVDSSQAIDITTTVTMNLVNGKEYGIIWFAKNDAAPWSVKATEKTIDFTLPTNEDGTEIAISHNLETYDAFYAYTTLKVEGAINRPVELYRPFAQVNFGTNDMYPTNDVDKQILANAFGDNLENLKTRMTISAKVPTTLSVEDNTVSGEQTILYAPSTVPSQTQEFPVDGYDYLAMNYILASQEGDVYTFDFTILNGENEYNTISVANAPVKANYRTNIFGQLLTSTANFNVVIEPEPIGEVNRDLGPWDGTTLTEVKPVTKTIDGEEVEVYPATSASELAWIAANINSGDLEADTYIELAADIDLNGKAWTPISNISRSNPSAGFSGTFDGNGFTVSGMNVVNSQDNYGASLISTTYNATVKNVTVVNSTFKSADHAGAIVGAMFGESTIENCTAGADVIIEGAGAVAGIVGRAYGTKNVVTGCESNAEVVGTGTAKTGGIVGIASASNSTTMIEDCVNNGIIAGTDKGVAGIVGYVGSPTTVKNCTNNGDVNSTKYSGGILGYLNGDPKNVNIESCENTGDINGSISGGIQGSVGQYGEVNIKECTNSGKIAATSYAGGIVGISGSGTLEDCSNTGEIESDDYAGGVAAELRNSTAKNCKGGSASVSGAVIGRICAHANSANPATSNFYLVEEEGAYDQEGIKTIGQVASGTALATVHIYSGTMVGTPLTGGGSASVIIIHEGAAWDAFPDQTGTWQKQTDGTWKKVS